VPLAHLSDRAVLKVAGPEARTFLDRLVTCDLDRLPPAENYERAVFPTLEEQNAAREVITTQWDSVVGADVAE